MCMWHRLKTTAPPSYPYRQAAAALWTAMAWCWPATTRPIRWSLRLTKPKMCKPPLMRWPKSFLSAHPTASAFTACAKTAVAMSRYRYATTSQMKKSHALPRGAMRFPGLKSTRGCFALTRMAKHQATWLATSPASTRKKKKHSKKAKTRSTTKALATLANSA